MYPSGFCEAVRHAQRELIQRDLDNERRATTSPGLDRATQGLAVTHQLIKIRCTIWDLGDRPVTDRSAQRCHVHLVEAVAERGIRRRPPQPQAECLGQAAVVADGKTLQIPQALAAAEDYEHRHQHQVPGRKTHAAPHPRIWDRSQIADKVEIACGGSTFKHKEGATPPSSTHADSTGKNTCDGL